MTLRARPRTTNPMLANPRMATPRQGDRRPGGASNAVVASGATAWFDGHDGSGLQVVPSRIGAGIVSLGTNNTVEASDPTWGSNAWTFDSVDDGMTTSGTGMTVTATLTTGAYAHLQVVTVNGLNSRFYWCQGNSSVRYLRLLSGSAAFALGARGPGGSFTSATQSWGAAGTKVVLGFVLNNGVANTYYYDGVTGTLGTNFDTTVAGDISANLTAPTYGNVSFGFGTGVGATMYSAVEWNGTAPSKATMDTVAAYMYTNS